MQAPSFIVTAGIALLFPTAISADQFTPYGFQSGHFASNDSTGSPQQQQQSTSSELLNDDSYAASSYYDAQHNLLFFAGSTYGTYFDSATDLSGEIRAAMGMSSAEGGRDASSPHLDNSDCFLGILKLPTADAGPMVVVGNGDGDAAPWLNHVDEDAAAGAGAGRKKPAEPELIYARRFGTPRNSEACSSVLMLPKVNDALLQSSAQMKLVLLGHVNPTPMSSADMNAVGPGAFDAGSGGGRNLKREWLLEDEGDGSSSSKQWSEGDSDEDRRLQSSANSVNRGGFFHSLSGGSPITAKGRAYGFVADFDLSLTMDESFSASIPSDTSFNNAYGALLGGGVLESSPLVYPAAMTQNKRDPNQLYVVSMHSDSDEVVINPEYQSNPDASAWVDPVDGTLHERADETVGGAGGSGSDLVGGVPKYGSDFYVKVQQLTITPYERLIDVEPTLDEKVKRTMEGGWGFGFKLNDANDVRPSSIVFVQGRTPNDDILLLGGTTRKEDDADGRRGELDGFITKLIPPAPAPVADMTTGDSLENAMEDESAHPTKRIDSTTGRDETVTAICVPPPDPIDGIVTHAFVVGSTSSNRGSGDDPSLAYIIKLRLDDLSTVWKERVPSIHPRGIGGDVLGEGCAVSPDGETVYLGGTIHGGSALNTNIMLNGGNGVPIAPVGGTSDVFVVAFDTEFGNVRWAKQLGTVYEDKLARGGGVACDNEGNVIIVGSTRGGLQRPRTPGEAGDPAATGRTSMASDVFVMSLSRADGDYVNAPFGRIPVSASGGGVELSTAAASASESPAGPTGGGGDGLSSGATAGIYLIAIGVSCVLLFCALHRGNLAHKIRRFRDSGNDEPDDILKMWDGDHMSYNNRPLGGRQESGHYGEKQGRPSNGGGKGLLRIVRGGSTGSEGDENSVYSTGSSSSQRSKENSDFLASLRKEANATMTKMVKNDTEDAVASDPRLDGEASIKSLLTHYREIKKDTLIDSNDNCGSDGAGSARGIGNASSSGTGGSRSSSGKTRKKGKRPPPPPPPRRKQNDRASSEKIVNSAGPTAPDGLSEFTIV